MSIVVAHARPRTADTGWSFEAVAAFGIGLFLVNNLYLASYAVGFPPGYAFGLAGLFSAMFAVRRLAIQDIARIGFNQFAVVLVLMSLLCLVADWTLFGPVGIDINGPVRIFCLAAYFSWVWTLQDRLDLRRFLYTFARWNFVVAAILAAAHYAIMQLVPDLMSLAYDVLLAEQYLDRISDRRVSGLFIDSNYFATAISLFFFMQLRFGPRPSLVTFAVYAFCINVSGSRLGLILFLILSIDLFLHAKLPFRLMTTALVLLTVILSLFFVDARRLSDYEQSGTNENLTARLLDPEVAAQVSGSTSSRVKSLLDGLSFGEQYRYAFGPGLLGFESRWERWVNDYVPHNAALTLFAQFGLLSLLPLAIVSRIGWRGAQMMGPSYAILFVGPVMLLPFFLYFPVGFLFMMLPSVGVRAGSGARARVASRPHGRGSQSLPLGARRGG